MDADGCKLFLGQCKCVEMPLWLMQTKVGDKVEGFHMHLNTSGLSMELMSNWQIECQHLEGVVQSSLIFIIQTLLGINVFI